MACPKCGCKVTYQYDDGWDLLQEPVAENLERCAACGEIFDIDDHTPEEEDDYDVTDEPTCKRCHGDGRDPWTDYLLPCPECQGEQH